MIQDSGNRTEFESGAVRDIQKGKGRCDLLPLEIVAKFMDDGIIEQIGIFQKSMAKSCLYQALNLFACKSDQSYPNMMLEVSKHFEEGCEKYGENNWQKGIPVDRYIDSAVRHYLKYLRGDTDERHDRAFVWNILCLWWTVDNIKNPS